MEANHLERPVFSVSEFAELFGIHHSTVRHEITAGKIRAVRIGRRLLIPRSERDRILTGAEPGEHTHSLHHVDAA